MIDRIEGELLFAVANQILGEASVKGVAEIKELRRRARISRAKLAYWEDRHSEDKV